MIKKKKRKKKYTCPIIKFRIYNLLFLTFIFVSFFIELKVRSNIAL